MYMYGSALQPRLPRHGHGLVCTLYLGGSVSDIVDMSMIDVGSTLPPPAKGWVGAR